MTHDNDYAQLAALAREIAREVEAREIAAREAELEANTTEAEREVDELKARIRRLEAARDAYQESREQLNVLWMQERARVEVLEAALEAIVKLAPDGKPPKDIDAGRLWTAGGIAREALAQRTVGGEG